MALCQPVGGRAGVPPTRAWPVLCVVVAACLAWTSADDTPIDTYTVKTCSTILISGHVGEFQDYVNGYYSTGESDVVKINGKINYQKVCVGCVCACKCLWSLVARQCTPVAE